MPDRAKQAKGRVATRTATGSVAALPASIYSHGQSTLPDGRIIVSGNGIAYMYVPSSNIWEEIVPLNVYAHGQSTLSDGRIMISGGQTGSSLVYIYSDDNNIWSKAANIITAFTWHSQSGMSDGRVIVSGGYGGGTPQKAVSVYSPNNNTWENTATLPVGMLRQKQSTLMNGNVLITGGTSSGGSGFGFRNTYVYTLDNGSGSWENGATLVSEIVNHAQSTLLDGKVLISGGATNSLVFDSSFMYAPDSNAWTNTAPLATGIGSHAQSTLADGRVLITYGSTAYIYTPAGWEDFQVNRGGTELIDKHFSLAYLSFFKRKVEGLPKSLLEFLGKRSNRLNL